MKLVALPVHDATRWLGLQLLLLPTAAALPSGMPAALSLQAAHPECQAPLGYPSCNDSPLNSPPSSPLSSPLSLCANNDNSTLRMDAVTDALCVEGKDCDGYSLPYAP